jgi:hypothetical protein
MKRADQIGLQPIIAIRRLQAGFLADSGGLINLTAREWVK